MLSVLMPVYNVAGYVAEAIESVLAQTHRDFALLVLDDGSTDRTADVARGYAERDPRVTVVSRPNRGIAHTMNEGLGRCEGGGPGGDWVACMHGDDVMLPNRLERQLAFVAGHPDVAVVSTLVDWIDETGRVVGRSRSPLTTPDAVAKTVAAGGTVAFPHPAVMFRKSVVQAVGGYRQDFWPAEDTELWNRIVGAGHKVLVQSEVLLKYRLHGKSASMSKSRLMMQKMRWMEQCVAARRGGHPEPTWGEFLRRRKAMGWAGRLNEHRRDLSRTLYQTAVGHYSARRYHLFAPALAGAAALDPKLILGRVVPRLAGR